MHRRTAPLGDDRRRCKQAAAESGIQSEGGASGQPEVGARLGILPSVETGLAPSYSASGDAALRLYGESHVELSLTRMATSTVAGAKSEGTPAKPRPPRPIARLLRYVFPY